MATTPPVASLGEVYADGRARISALLADLTDDEAATTVPTCPDWTVRDVAAHLAGTCADILAGNIDGVATEPWTAAQVEARRGASLAEILTEWAEVASQVEPLAGMFPGKAAEQWIADQTTHEHDLRGALGRPGERDSTGLAVALDFLVSFGLDNSCNARGLGPIEVLAGDRRWVVGSATPTGADPGLRFAGGVDTDPGGDGPVEEPEPVARLEAPAFELFRATTGRRSSRQIAALGWNVDPTPYLDAFDYGPFTTSPVDIAE